MKNSPKTNRRRQKSKKRPLLPISEATAAGIRKTLGITNKKVNEALKIWRRAGAKI